MSKVYIEESVIKAYEKELSKLNDQIRDMNDKFQKTICELSEEHIKELEEYKAKAEKYDEAIKGLNKASLDVFGKECNFELNEMTAHNLFIKSVANTDKDLCFKYGNALKRIEELEKELDVKCGTCNKSQMYDTYKKLYLELSEKYHTQEQAICNTVIKKINELEQKNKVLVEGVKPIIKRVYLIEEGNVIALGVNLYSFLNYDDAEKYKAMLELVEVSKDE